MGIIFGAVMILTFFSGWCQGICFLDATYPVKGR